MSSAIFDPVYMNCWAILYTRRKSTLSNPVDFDTLAEAYLRHREEDHWAWEEVHRMIRNGLSEGWETTLLLLERAKSDNDIGYIAAGSLEDLIDFHGHKALDLIDEECRNNSRLQLALSQAGVLFYYDEFERWHALLCKYGFRKIPTIESRVVTPKVMHLMNCFLNKTIGVADYDFNMNEWLDGPLDDKRAQRVLQAAYYDLERLNDTTPPEYRNPQMLRESELSARVKQLLNELESLGYRAAG